MSNVLTSATTWRFGGSRLNPSSGSPFASAAVRVFPMPPVEESVCLTHTASSPNHPRSRQMKHLTRPELDAGIDHIQESPSDEGRLEMLVRRPSTDEREILDSGVLDIEEGLVGDNWQDNKYGLDPAEHLETQVTVMNSRAAALVAQDRERWPLAGDQMYIDLDLSNHNLPPGTRLQLGDAVIEVTEFPHRGCQKFSVRFGADATRFVNSKQGRELNLRGVNARVVQPGTIRVGDIARKIQRHK